MTPASHACSSATARKLTDSKAHGYTDPGTPFDVKCASVAGARAAPCATRGITIFTMLCLVGHEKLAVP